MITVCELEKMAHDLVFNFQSFIPEHLRHCSDFIKCQYLIKTFNIYLNPVVSYTTRPKRDNETDGVEHYFISKEAADAKLSKENLLAYTKIGDIEYFATTESLNGSNIYIIDPNGVKFLKEHNPYADIYVIYISTPDEIRKERCKNRSDFATSFQKRIESENEQFTEFEKSKQWNLNIWNEYSIFSSVTLLLVNIFKLKIMTDKNKNTLFLVVGRSGSGKDTIITEAINYLDKLRNIEKVLIKE